MMVGVGLFRPPLSPSPSPPKVSPQWHYHLPPHTMSMVGDVPIASKGRIGMGSNWQPTMRKFSSSKWQSKPDHLINLQDIKRDLESSSNPSQVSEAMSRWKGKISFRLMMSILSQERSWRRAVALHDWMLAEGGFSPSSFAYNIVLRDVLRARKWKLADGLVDEMRENGVDPDKFTYSTLISSYGKDGKLDCAMHWFRTMDENGIKADLVTFTTLIELAGRLKDYTRAASLFSKMRAASIKPDRIVYNSMVNVFGKAKLYREAHSLLAEMERDGYPPDTVTYSTLINVYTEGEKFEEALSVFDEMRQKECFVDLTTCNMAINAYGRLGFVKEAEKLFWSMKEKGLTPNEVSYNTLLKVYAGAELIGQAIHTFKTMEEKPNMIKPNIITYNTMIAIYGIMLDYENAGKLVSRMQMNGIQPTAVTYATLISIYGKAGKVEKAVRLFQELQRKSFEMDEILYQSMIVVYERAGMVAHAKRLVHELAMPDRKIHQSTAINVLALAGKVEDASRLFNKAYQEDQITDINVYKNMISLFVSNRRCKNAIETHERMKKQGLLPDSETCLLLLNAYNRLKRVKDAEKFYLDLLEQECILDEEVHFEMMKIYAGVGKLASAEGIFEVLNKSHVEVSKKNLYLCMGALYENAGKFEAAAKNQQESVWILVRKCKNMLDFPSRICTFKNATL